MKHLKGFTLAEFVVAVAILTVVGIALSKFQSDIFTLNFTARGNLAVQLDARHVVKEMAAELREAAPSSLGGYPVAVASTSALTFYTDINNDGFEDQVRYFMSGTSLMIGITYPSGTPLSYNPASEQLSTLVYNITNAASSTLPIFQYYDENYTGTSSPLAQPVNILSIRLIKITLVIDKDSNKSPSPITVTTDVELRNLKDNL